MIWAENLYVSDTAKKRREKIIRKANQNSGLLHVYFITLASNGSDLFDIFDASYLKQPSFYKQDLKVVGIATDKSEAIHLVKEIVHDMYCKTGEFQTSNYFIFGERDSREHKRRRSRVCGLFSSRFLKS